MPVFPLVGSSSPRPGSSSPAASAVSIIERATRSLIDPVGFSPSSFAYRPTSGLGDSRVSSTSGVLPIRSRMLGAVTLATGHSRQQDDGVALGDLRLEAAAGANVLALDVDVHERRQLLVLEQLSAQRGELAHQVVEQFADVLALGQHLALAVGLGAQRGGDPDDAHAPTRQNS